mmetsp:Transcript_3340/g.11216  ORF Transcript_3340/g.11216 Transcript_3340/m.11216 type:complete len:264 (-) Transcript_3340:1068-1859(-)
MLAPMSTDADEGFASLVKMSLVSTPSIAPALKLPAAKFPTFPVRVASTSYTTEHASSNVSETPTSQPSVFSSGPAIFSATSTMTGVSAMDAMTTTTRSSSKLAGNSDPADPLVACPKITKANSPPCDMNAPATKASRHVSPVNGPSAVTTPVLTTMSVSVIVATMGNMSIASGRSMVVPMVTKKSDKNKPLNARSSFMMSCAYGVPARHKPARNAPRESLNPIALVAFENPNSTSSEHATKTSVPHSNCTMVLYSQHAAKYPA